MPGSPATSPRFGANRYADTDTASFSSQVNDVTDTFDAGAEHRWVPNVLSGSATVANHQIVVAGPNETVTLPTPTSEHEMVCVYANETVTGASPVTVAYGGAGGGKIYGKGLRTGATSFVLGFPGSFAWLFSPDGVNWKIIHGERDTGWVGLSFMSGVSAQASGFAPSARLRGDYVFLRGALQSTSATSTWATVPGACWPAEIAYVQYGGNLYVDSSQSLQTPGMITSTPAGTTLYLDGLNYALDD